MASAERISSSNKVDQIISDVADLKASQRYLIQSVDEIKRTAYVNKADYAEDLAVLREDLKTHAASIRALDERTRNTPTVEKVVFGLVGLILTSVVIAVVALVVSKGSS